MFQFNFARKFLSTALIATGAMAAVAIPQTSSASVGLYVQYGSPAQYEYVEPYRQTRQGYLWVPGYWDWRGHRQVWIEGTWARQRHVHHYQSHRWDERNRGWNQGRGRWDRDGDGIPDYRDNRPNTPRRW